MGEALVLIRFLTRALVRRSASVISSQTFAWHRSRFKSWDEQL
jgi:hypothetical protein